MPAPTVCVISGGVGAARFLAGLVQVHPPEQVTAVVNVGDDLELHGLRISPDLDTVTYTLAGATDPERGWGLAGETWHAMEALGRYGGETWFSLGDRDLGTHLYRTHRLGQGAPLSRVTAEITRAWGLRLTVLPVTDDPLRTVLTVDGDEISFQEYFVARRHSVEVTAVRFTGADTARPAPGVLDAVSGAQVVVIAPSNPLVSIDPVLAVPGVREELETARERAVAVSPIVAGAALKGPADRLMRELGHDPTVVGIAHMYAPFVSTLVIDSADAALASDVERAGVRCVVAATVMRDATVAAALADVVCGAVAP